MPKRMVKITENSFREIMAKAHRLHETVTSEITKARADGRDVMCVMAEYGTKRGELIDFTKVNEDGTIDEDSETYKARVLAVSPPRTVNVEGASINCVEVICAAIQPGDLETLDGFVAMYGDDECEATEGQTGAEETDTCSCGANRQMCEKNQELFGGHLHEKENL